MSAFRAKGRRFFETNVPYLKDGKVRWRKMPQGTQDPRTAKAIDAMIAALGPADLKAWALLEAVTGTPQRWTLSELFDRWTAVPSTRADRNQKPIPADKHERRDALLDQLHDVDLEPLVNAFYKVLIGPSRKLSEDTAKHYRSAVRDLIPEGVPFRRSDFTARDLRIWIEEMDDVVPATVRKRGVGMGQFAQWLVGRGILPVDPMRDVALPPQGDPLSHFIDVPDVGRLADASPGVMRLYETILPATALEVSTALTVRVRDVSIDDKSIQAPGTKSYNRKRVVRVAEFGWDAVLEAIKGKHRDSRLFEEIPHRFRARDDHADTIDALLEKGHRVYGTMEGGIAHRYTLRDHRHTWAVRAVKSGWPIHAVAAQLGHATPVLALKVYGRHEPKNEERDRYEERSHARDLQLDAARKRQGDGNG